MHKVSVCFAEACCSKGWITTEETPWCAYAMERKLITVLFFVLLLPVVLILDVLKEAAIFSFVMYFLRRRYGGWHAPYLWLCQGLSILLVLIVTLVIGPRLLTFPMQLIWSADIALIVLAFFQKPVYQPQMHFDENVIRANRRKKDQLLVFVFAAQVVLYVLDNSFLIYSFLGVLTGVVSVYIELLQQLINRERNYYEKT